MRLALTLSLIGHPFNDFSELIPLSVKITSSIVPTLSGPIPNIEAFLSRSISS